MNVIKCRHMKPIPYKYLLLRIIFFTLAFESASTLLHPSTTIKGSYSVDGSKTILRSSNNAESEMEYTLLRNNKEENSDMKSSTRRIYTLSNNNYENKKTKPPSLTEMKVYLSSNHTTSSMKLQTNKNHTARTKTVIPYNLPYDSALKVLKLYHRQHGNLVIPKRYRIPPTSEFPTEWHNLQLSTIVYNMKWWTIHVQYKPNRVYELNQLGFIWERLQPEWNLFIEALIIYKSLYGHIRVPVSFVVPSGNDSSSSSLLSSSGTQYSESKMIWPRSTWGIALGSCVHRIRTRSDFLRDENTSFSRRKQLDGLGFIWDTSEASFLKFFKALRLFSKLQQELDGQPSSKTNNLTDNNNIIHDAEINSDILRKENDSKSLPAVDTKTRRKRLSKALRIPSQYIIPSNNTYWPPDLWSYPLGAKCAAVRQKGLYIKNQPERRKALEELGFRLDDGNASLGWLEVVHAAAIYSRMHGRVCDVPVNFVVPSPPPNFCSTHLDENGEDISLLEEDEKACWPWPEQLWGLQLGQRLKDVRLKGAYLKKPENASARRAQLDALGFVWEKKRGRRKRSLGGDDNLNQ